MESETLKVKSPVRSPCLPLRHRDRVASMGAKVLATHQDSKTTLENYLGYRSANM